MHLTGCWLRFCWLSTVLAFRRGLVRAIFGLAGLFIGFKLAGWTYIHLGDLIVYLKFMSSSASARIVAFLVVLATGAALCEVAGHRTQRTVRAAGLSLLDHLLGLAFGFVRGCVLGIALLMITVNFSPQAQVVTTSVLSPYLFAAAHDVSFLVPQYIQQLMANGSSNAKPAPPSWIIRH